MEKPTKNPTLLKIGRNFKNILVIFPRLINFLPIDICFYLVNVGTVSNTNQFFPLFVASIPATYENTNYSLTVNEVLPLINHPVVQAGANFTGANSKVSPKLRGLMLNRGQALYAAASGASALTNGFYVGVQGGYY